MRPLTAMVDFAKTEERRAKLPAIFCEVIFSAKYFLRNLDIFIFSNYCNTPRTPNIHKDADLRGLDAGLRRMGQMRVVTTSPLALSRHLGSGHLVCTPICYENNCRRSIFRLEKF